MIQKNELRIGNLVHVDGDNDTMFTIIQLKIKVAFVKSRSVFQVDYDLLHPIFITSDTLAKCGFNKLENNTSTSAKEYILKIPATGDSNHDIYATIHNQDPKQTFAKARINGQHVGNELIYLHQIQNVYHALISKEMEIAKLLIILPL